MKVKVVINEQHKLLPQQEEVIKQQFGDKIELEFIKIPAEGLNRLEIESLAIDLVDQQKDPVVVISPIPLLIAKMISTKWFNFVELRESLREPLVFLMHNDKREKIEKDGKVFYKVLPDGWELIRI